MCGGARKNAFPERCATVARRSHSSSGGGGQVSCAVSIATEMESRTVAGAFGEPFWLGHKWRNAESSAEARGRTVGGQLLPWRRFICSQRRRHLSLPFGALLSWRWRRPSGAGSRELTCENPYCPLFARPLERAPGQPRAARKIEAHLRAHLNNNARAVRLRFSLGFSLGFAAVYLEFIVGVGPICAPRERERERDDRRPSVAATQLGWADNFSHRSAAGAGAR